MVYLAGDNDLDSAGVVDLGEMKQVGSSDQINIVAQFDRAGAKVRPKRYLLRKGTTLAKDVVATLGETNMGDPNVLQDFLAWGAKNYPAEHYLVVIWNHGAGWDDENIYRSVKRGLKRNVSYKKSSVGETVRGAAGAVPIAHVRAMSKRPFKRALFSTTIQQAVPKRAIAFDDQAEDFLDNIELKRVLTAAKKSFGGKIDVLGMDACLMNMVEVAYQVRNTAAGIGRFAGGGARGRLALHHGAAGAGQDPRHDAGAGRQGDSRPLSCLLQAERRRYPVDVGPVRFDQARRGDRQARRRRSSRNCRPRLPRSQ